MTVTVQWKQENALTASPLNRIKRTMINEMLREHEYVRNWERNHSNVTVTVAYVLVHLYHGGRANNDLGAPNT